MNTAFINQKLAELSLYSFTFISFTLHHITAERNCLEWREFATIFGLEYFILHFATDTPTATMLQKMKHNQWDGAHVWFLYF
jgi:hypothetical protein